MKIKDTSYATGEKQQNLQLLDILVHNPVKEAGVMTPLFYAALTHSDKQVYPGPP